MKLKRTRGHWALAARVALSIAPVAICCCSSGCSAAGGPPGPGTLVLFATFAAVAYLRAGLARRSR